MGGCQMTCPDLPCQHLLCCRGPPVQQRHSYPSPGFRFLLITFGAGKRHPNINVNPRNWRNMLIPHWVVDKWTVGRTTAWLRGCLVFANTLCVAADEQLGLQLQSNHYFIWKGTQRSNRKRTASQFVCLQICLSHLWGGDRWSGSSTDNKAQPALVCLIGLQQGHLNKTKWLLFPLGCQDRRQRPAKSAATVGGREQSAHISVCLQRWQDGP